MKSCRLLIKRVVFYFLLVVLSSCSSGIPEFEKVQSESGFKLFNMLDEYPAFKSSFSNLNEHKFNDLMAKAINADIAASKDILGLMPSITQSIINILGTTRLTVNRIIEQDNLDDPTDPYNNYSDDFYSFIDTLSEQKTGVSKQIVSIFGKSLNYIKFKHGADGDDDIEAIMSDLKNFLTSTEDDGVTPQTGQTLKTVLPLMQSGLAKLLIQNRISMKLNSDGTLDNDGSGDNLDSDLGNAVLGVDSLISGFNDIATGDTDARDAFNDFMRESGNLLTKEVGGKNSATVLQELMTNIEDFATQGGSDYGNVGDTNDYNQNSSGIYVNTELRNGVKEMWPSLVSLFIKAKGSWETKPDYSVISDPENGESPIEILTKQFHNLKTNCDIDLNDTSSSYGNGGIEQSLMRMITHNGFGEERSSADYKVSYLDHMLYTLSGSYAFGFKADLSPNSSREPFENHGYGHGDETGGIITLNDSLYSMETGIKSDPLGGKHTAYSLALSIRTEQANSVFRSHQPFVRSDRLSHKFYLGYDIPTLNLLQGFSVGDAGLPNGGETVETVKKADGNIYSISTIENTTNGEDYKTFYPKVGNGIGDANTGRWVMGWIARSTWEGEGPYYSKKAITGKPSTTTLNVDGTDQTINIYYRPSGKIYAYVYKPDPADASTWSYFYPKEDGDKEDSTATTWQNAGSPMFERTNKYQASWRTDYYLIQTPSSGGGDGGYTYSPAHVVGKTGSRKFKMAEFSSNRDHSTGDSGALWYWEKIAENDSTRECETQEEAMTRNFQWVMLEKKFVFIIPMRAHVSKCGVEVDSAIYNILEMNGIVGITNAKKNTDGNGQWNIKDNEGLDIVQIQPQSISSYDTPSTGINYGDSYELGDSRVSVFAKEVYDSVAGVGDQVDIPTVYDTVLGLNHVLPDVVGQNIAPITRMSLLESTEIASNDPLIGDESSEVWQRRNKLFPIIVSLVGTLHEQTFYDEGTAGDHSYNYAGNHKYPLKSIRDLIFMLGQPLMRHFKFDGHSWWASRMNGEGSEHKAYAHFSPAGTSGIDYRPKDDLKSVISLLSESGTNAEARADGLIPLMTQTKSITKLLNFLQLTGKPDGVYTDTNKEINDYTDWGARRKIFYGFEQIFTSMKADKGTATVEGWFDVFHPAWMFAKRDNDIDLDVALDELIGSDTLVNSDGSFGKGIAKFVDNKESETVPWQNFHRNMRDLAELLSIEGTTSGKYSIMEDIIRMNMSLLSSFKASDKQLRGLRHTLGAMLAYYDKDESKWKSSPELIQILTVDLPEILTAFDGHYDNALTFGSNLFDESGFIEYFLGALTSDYYAKDTIMDINKFLMDDLITDSNSKFWVDLNKLVLQLNELLANDSNVQVKSKSYQSFGKLLNR